ncbi:hypothetical protein I7I50_03483 [Histoplasma capsulatum G186AR]|uniref:Uncharacterized protein n=1 Tax=Ajellomyces capsulatus TaxID=5037 RepID=A0A8H7YKJ4_AJECA|nr:hypothetical protein I7I52_04390 [Histoplasma capsulatum]QSS74618.1 hypothetical protein I7I50_03483 [Histoplasma capsulatum G186AR]
MNSQRVRGVCVRVWSSGDPGGSSSWWWWLLLLKLGVWREKNEDASDVKAKEGKKKEQPTQQQPMRTDELTNRQRPGTSRTE